MTKYAYVYMKDSQWATFHEWEAITEGSFVNIIPQAQGCIFLKLQQTPPPQSHLLIVVITKTTDDVILQSLHNCINLIKY